MGKKLISWTRNCSKLAVLLLFHFLVLMPVSAQFNTDRLVMIGRSALYYEDYVLSIQYFNQAILIFFNFNIYLFFQAISF